MEVLYIMNLNIHAWMLINIHTQNKANSLVAEISLRSLSDGWSAYASPLGR